MKIFPPAYPLHTQPGLGGGVHTSAGLTIWQKRHMPRAPRFWGPRASLFYFFSEFFCFLFQRGAQTVRQSGAPKSLSPPENSRPQKIDPKRFPFLFPVLVFQRGAPKSPRSPENVIGPQNLKMEAPKCGFFCSLF